MNLAYTQLQKRKQYLERLLSEAEQQLSGLPEGKLRVRNDQGIPRYYHITRPGDTKGQYIRKKDAALAHRLAQKDYLLRLQKEVRDELQDINNYLKKYGRANLEDIYTNLNDYRRPLVTPIAEPDDIFAERWKKASYKTNPYHPEELVYPTKQGELVRSKSEVLLADMYYELGIPYRYEAELQLKNGKKKYPDFTLLHTETRKIIYHEHLGLMDRNEYRISNLNKLKEYRRSGIYTGKNLILTHEAEGCYLNIKEIRQMVQEIFPCAAVV